MRETQFIKQNKEKWQALEDALASRHTDAENLDHLFVEVTDDLSYSRTFYPNRSVRVYLNGLAQRIFFHIYRNKKNSFGHFRLFWTDELPRLMYESRQHLRLSFIIFVLAILIGTLSSAMDSSFPHIILGDNYVEMTIKNIEKGDPMAVYKQKGAFGMAMGITFNNIWVAFLTFVMGIFYAVGTVGVLLSNGIMLGAFQYFFYARGLFWSSFLTIWMHGTLEISAIILAGAAGLTMGSGLVFPKTYTRLHAFQLSARRGLKMMVGITPIFVIAGFIEGFITRYTEIPGVFRGIFILFCLAFVLFYFVWYPKKKAKEGFKMAVREAKIPPDAPQIVDFLEIKSNAAIFADVFVLYRKYFRSILKAASVVALLFTILTFLGSKGDSSSAFQYSWERLGNLKAVTQFWVNINIDFLQIINILLYSYLIINILILIQKETKTHHLSIFSTQSIFQAAKVLIVMTLFFSTVAVSQNILGLVASIPFVILWIYVMNHEQIGFVNGIKRSIYLLPNGLMRLIVIVFSLSFIGIFAFLLLDTGLLWFYFEILTWNFTLDEASAQQLATFILTFSTMLIIGLLIPLFIFGVAILYHTLIEIREARGLHERITKIGIIKRIQGLEQEN